MKKQSLKISIITPSFNQGMFIEETITSVMDQNYPNTEHIVVDAGSTDNTLQILKKFGHKIKWISEPDNGQSDAINKGIKMATGDIIAFINSDDYYLPGAFKKVIAYFEKHPDTKLLTGDYIIINSKKDKIHHYIYWYKKILRNFPNFTMLCFANFIAQPSTFWRKSTSHEIGLFNINLRYTMDYDYWLRVMEKYPLSVIDDVLSAFRVHKESKGGSQYKSQFREEIKVASNFTNNRFLMLFKRFHNWLIVRIYSIIK